MPIEQYNSRVGRARLANAARIQARSRACLLDPATVASMDSSNSSQSGTPPLIAPTATPPPAPAPAPAASPPAGLSLAARLKLRDGAAIQAAVRRRQHPQRCGRLPLSCWRWSGVGGVGEWLGEMLDAFAAALRANRTFGLALEPLPFLDVRRCNTRDWRCLVVPPTSCTLKPVDTAAALGSSSAPLPSLPQPRPWAPRLILGSAPSRFKATCQPSSGPPKAENLRPNPLAGTPRASPSNGWAGGPSPS